MNTPHDSHRPISGKRGFFDRLTQSKVFVAVQIALSVLAIVVPVILFYLSSERGEVTLSAIEATRFIDPDGALLSDIRIIYKDNQAKNIVRMTLEISNTGNTDLDGAAVKRLLWHPPVGTSVLELSVEYPQRKFGEFLAVSKIETQPQVEAEGLTFEVSSFNRGAEAVVQILLLSSLADPDLSTAEADAVITGASFVDYSNSLLRASHDSLSPRVFDGGLGLNVGRALVLYVGLALFVLVVVYPFSKISDVLEKHRVLKMLKELPVSEPTDSLLKSLEGGSSYNVSKPVSFFSRLNLEQLQLCRSILKRTNGRDISKLVSGGMLSSEERHILSSMPEVDEFLGSLYHFRHQFRPETFVEVFIERKKREASSIQ